MDYIILLNAYISNDFKGLFKLIICHALFYLLEIMVVVVKDLRLMKQQANAPVSISIFLKNLFNFRLHFIKHTVLDWKIKWQYC